MRRARAGGTVVGVSEQLIERDEVVALLFNVSDVVAILLRIQTLLEGEVGEEEESEGD